MPFDERFHYTHEAMRTAGRHAHGTDSVERTDMRDPIDQLRRNAKNTIGDKPSERGVTAYAFPWSPSFSMSKDSATMMLSLMSTDTPERVFSRCPIYRRLTAAQRRELVLRGPKGVVNFRSYAWSLMYQGIEAYVKFEPGGVSPVTALALLCPEPRIERRFGALSDAVVIPESIRHPRKSFASSRRRETPFWAVIVWALKRYAAMSWNDVNGLSNVFPPDSPVGRRGATRRVLPAACGRGSGAGELPSVHSGSPEFAVMGARTHAGPEAIRADLPIEPYRIAPPLLCSDRLIAPDT
jgi:hypothetical protein